MHLCHPTHFLKFITLTTIFSTIVAFTCKSAKLGLCDCQNISTYHLLKCDKNYAEPFNIVIHDNRYEIGCQKNQIPQVTFSLHSKHERIQSADFFGFINCTLQPNNVFSTLISKLINTTHTTKLTIKQSNVTYISGPMLSGLENVKILDLEKCHGLQNLPEDLLYNLQNLTSLTLHSNDFRTVPERFFRRTKNLEQITMIGHSFQEFPKNLFVNLTSLVKLTLMDNKLRLMRPDSFVGLISLEVLKLGNNQLEELPEDIFREVIKLREVDLSMNHLKRLPDKLFAQNPELRSVQFAENYLEVLPEGLLSYRIQLEEVVMNKCKFNILPENIFWGCRNLKSLNLSANKLRSLPSKLFKDTTNLEYLDLQSNYLQDLTDEIFVNLSELKVLNLAENRLFLQQEMFHPLKNLEELHLENNNLSVIPGSAFKTNVKLVTLNLSHNRLALVENHLFFLNSSVEKHSIFSHLSRLKNLYLQHNLISYIFSDWTWNLGSLENLDLSHNKVKEVSFRELNFIQNQQLKVNLEQNEIETVDLSTAELYVNPNTSRHDLENTRTYIKLKGNPLKCDCRIFDLLRYFDGSMNPLVQSMLALNADDLICQSPPKYANLKINQITSKSLTCVLDDGPKTPENCSSPYFSFRQWDNRMFMDCSNSGLTKVPSVSWANFSRYGLKAEKIQFQVVLSGNKLKEMPEPGTGYDHVIELDVSDNKIDNILWVPPRIKVLKLHGNKLTSLDCNELSLINQTSIKNITFHNNPWNCDCNLLNFTNYLQEKFRVVMDLHNVTCAKSPYLELTTISKEQLCPVSIELVITVCLILGFLGAIIGVLSALYFRFRLQIKVFLYARNLCLYFITEQELDSNKTYDAFISFSHKDEDFVTEKLIPELEEGSTPFKLCVHYRNWIPGELIATNIARSIEESRRTIVVLSKNFLKSEWGRVEFKTAHTEAMKEGRARLIVVIYGDVEEEEMDKEFKAYLKTKTYIKWDSPWFWDNLRYAMPHSSSAFGRLKPTVMSSPDLIPNEMNKQTHPVSPSTSQHRLVNETATISDQPCVVDNNDEDRRCERIDLDLNKITLNHYNNNNSVFSNEAHTFV